MSSGLHGGDGGHVDEGAVHAWLDGQLADDEAARIAAHVEGCAVCSAVVADARGHIAAATRIISALDGVPAHVVPRANRRINRWHLRAAAAIVIVAVGTTIVLRGAGGSLRSMYEVRGVPAARAPDAPAAQQVAPVPTPPVGGVPRAAAPMVRPAPKQKGTPENSASHAPEPPALVAKARRESTIVVHATPRADAASGAAIQPQAVVTDEAERTAPPVDTGGVPAPTVENALQGRAPAPALPQNAQVAAGQASALAARATAANRVATTAAAVATRADATSDTAVHITGRVVEADAGKPIPAASIVVSGTTIGSNTSDSGSFALAVPAGAKVLTARRIGFLAQTVPLTPGATDYTIPMKKDVLRLEAQVVTGVATTVSSPNAASVMKATLDSTGVAARDASRCRDHIVHVAVSEVAAEDSMSVRLTGVPSIDMKHPGLVVRPVPDTTAAEFGRWQPLGADSALVTLSNPAGTIPRRVACGGSE